MSTRTLKWFNGAPARLVCGMAVRRTSTQAIELIGTHTASEAESVIILDCAEWAQMIEIYELEWLGKTGAV